MSLQSKNTINVGTDNTGTSINIGTSSTPVTITTISGQVIVNIDTCASTPASANGNVLCQDSGTLKLK